VLLIAAPRGFAATLGELPAGAELVTDGRGPFAVIVCFTTARKDLARRLAPLERRLADKGALWIAWPKKASKVPTDVTEDVVRALAPSSGLVDVKVCAIDAVYSGLKLARRRKPR
jgi:hypothetical protein